MKLKAFTLLELVVALAISSVVSGIVYTGWTFVNKNYENQKNEQAKVYDMHLFHAVLGRDIDLSKVISKNGEYGLLCKPNMQVVAYNFFEEYITRSTGEISDTFHLAAEKVEMNEISGQLVTHITLFTSLNGQPIELLFRKQYASDILMKYTNGH